MFEHERHGPSHVVITRWPAVLEWAPVMAKWEVRQDITDRLLEHDAVEAADIYGRTTQDMPVYRGMVRLRRGIAATMQLEVEMRQILRALTSGDAVIHLDIIPTLPLFLPRPTATPIEAPTTAVKIPYPELPTAAYFGLPDFPDAFIAVRVPKDGLVLYRLVRSRTPVEADFTAPVEAWRAKGVSDVLAFGLSHYLTPESALRVKRKATSEIAEIQLQPNERVHVARTASLAGGDHVTVWAPPQLLLEGLTGRFV